MDEICGSNRNVCRPTDASLFTVSKFQNRLGRVSSIVEYEEESRDDDQLAVEEAGQRKGWPFLF